MPTDLKDRCDIHMGTTTHVIERHCHLATGHKERHEIEPERVTLLERALQALVNALDACEPGIKTAFTFSQLHGQNYIGPTYEAELVEAKAVLEDPDAP